MLLRGLGVGHSINDTHDHSSTADGESTHVAKTPAGVVAGSGVLLAVLQRRGRCDQRDGSRDAERRRVGQVRGQGQAVTGVCLCLCVTEWASYTNTVYYAVKE